MTRFCRRNYLFTCWGAALTMLVGVCCVGTSMGQEATGSTTIQPETFSSESPRQRDDPPAEQTEEEDLLGLNPDFVAAYKSLDASLNYEPEKPLRVRTRVVATGLLGGAFLGMLLVIFGYLKLNHLTRGFYSGRLQTLAIATAFLILGVCYFLWTQVLFK